MAGIYITKTGEWDKALRTLSNLSKNIKSVYEERLQKDGEEFLKRVLEHIDNQDLNWIPLAESTIALKSGDTTIYVESGYLRENLEVVKVTSSSDSDFAVFVGASEEKIHPSGVNFSDLMFWLEYGTERIPPRPLLQPTWDEVEPTLRYTWKNVLTDLINKGGVK